MAKEDFCFTYYDGDAARDKAHMTRLQRGAYDDIISAQRKKGHLSVDDIKRVLSKDFEECWPAIEWVLLTDADGKFYIEWVDKSVVKGRANSKKNKDRIDEYWRKVEAGEIIPKNKNGNTKHKPNENHGTSAVIPLENEDEDGNEYGNKEEIDIDLLLQKVILNPEYRKYCEEAGYPPAKLERWMEAFNRFLKFKGKYRCREDLWRLGFPGWMCYHNYQSGENPDEYNPVIWAKKKKEDYDKIFNDGTYKQNTGKSSGKPGTSDARVDALKNW